MQPRQAHGVGRQRGRRAREQALQALEVFALQAAAQAVDVLATAQLAPDRVLQRGIGLVEADRALALRRRQVVGQLQQAAGRARAEQAVERLRLQRQHGLRYRQRPGAAELDVVRRERGQELGLEAEAVVAEQLGGEEAQGRALPRRLDRAEGGPAAAGQVAFRVHAAHVLGGQRRQAVDLAKARQHAAPCTFGVVAGLGLAFLHARPQLLAQGQAALRVGQRIVAEVELVHQRVEAVADEVAIVGKGQRLVVAAALGHRPQRLGHGRVLRLVAVFDGPVVVGA